MSGAVRDVGQEEFVTSGRVMVDGRDATGATKLEREL